MHKELFSQEKHIIIIGFVLNAVTDTTIYGNYTFMFLATGLKTDSYAFHIQCCRIDCKAKCMIMLMVENKPRLYLDANRLKSIKGKMDRYNLFKCSRG